MAPFSSSSSSSTEKNSRILVNVESSLPDLLLVSYRSSNNDNFIGVLLRKTSAVSQVSPFGISPPEGFENRLKSDNPRDYDSEFFHTLSKRHTYYQSVEPSKTKPQIVKKLGVRLRARQVLCSHCKNVCNDKGENVERRFPKRERKNSESQLSRKFTLVPKIKRLEPEEIQHYKEPSSSLSSVSPEAPLIKIKLSSSGRNLRKKRSAVGSMEDLWDETVFEESGTGGSLNEVVPSTPILKISFGSSGTVLKIPAKYRKEESESLLQTEKDASAKAARRALKRARKEAQKRETTALSSNLSSCNSHCVSSSETHFSKISSPVSNSSYSVILPSSSQSQKMIIRKPKSHKKKKHKKNKKLSDKIMMSTVSDVNLENEETTVNSCVIENEKTLCVGDIVWGKRDQNPWWPAKVTNIFLRPDKEGKITPEIKITWYSYEGSSLLVTAQIKPFKEFFSDCFRQNSSPNSEVSGLIEAVRVASEENKAKDNWSPKHETTLLSSPILNS